MKHFARACVYAHFMRMHNYFEKIMSVADTFRSVVHAFYIEHTSAPFIAINLIGFVSSYDSNGAKTLTQRQRIVVSLFEKKKKKIMQICLQCGRAISPSVTKIHAQTTHALF